MDFTTSRVAILSAVAVLGLPMALAAQPAADTSGIDETTRHYGITDVVERPEGTIRLATYNVLNLFDDDDDPDLFDRNEDRTNTKPEHERAALAEAIRAIDADIIALQEVESEAAVKWFLEQHLDGLGYNHVVSIDAGDGRGIENAVISRYPLSEAKVWPSLPLGGVHPKKWGDKPNYRAGESLEFRRSPLNVTATIPSAIGDDPYRITMFVVHHKSGFGGGYWREAEATKVVELAQRLERDDPRANIVVLGDFNCRHGDAPLEVYAGAGFVDAFQGRTDENARYATHESGRAYDHILFNESMVAEFVPDTRFIYGTPCRAPGTDWRTTPTPDGFASDHFPVVVDITPVDAD